MPVVGDLIREAESEGVAEGLEASGRPAIVLDHAGQVAYLTASTRSLVGRDFTVVDGYLKGLNPETDTAFGKLCAWARGAAPKPGSFLISRGADNRRPLITMPLRRIKGNDAPDFARSIVAFVDLEYAPSPPIEHLQGLFQLTPSEAEIATHISNGMSAKQIAEARDVSPETVRGQLKSVYRKLDLKKQSDIVRLVERLSCGPFTHSRRRLHRE